MYNIGKLVREGRKRAGLTQEELSHGICTPSSLSKIENGVQEPTMVVFNALMQRIGMECEIYPVLSSEKELHLFSLKREIIKNIMCCEEDGKCAEELINKYESIGARYGKIHKQSVLYLRAICYIKKRVESTVVLEMLFDAINITMPNFQKTNLKNINFLTFDEIIIINNIAIIYHRMGKNLEAVNILNMVKEYLDTNAIENEMIKKQYPTILYNLSKFISKLENYDSAIEICDKGIDMCSKFDTFRILPYLLKLKAYILFKKESKVDALEDIKRAYIIFDLQGNSKQIKKTEKLIEQIKLSRN